MWETVLRKFTKSFVLLLIIMPYSGITQEAQQCSDPKFQNKVASTLSFTVPIISVSDVLGYKKDEIILLDVRELEEYETSHIPGALYIGYENPDWSVLDNIPQDAKVITYCSIGYRSEKLGEMLQEKGYSSVFNLYGSIFEWANRGLPLENQDGDNTHQIHTYNKKWSQWVSNPSIKKTW